MSGPARGEPLVPARRGLLVPALATALVVALFLSLGFWQLRRLEWKEALLARIEARAAAPAAPLPPAIDWRALPPDDYAFRRVAARGAFSGRDALVFAGPVAVDRGPARSGYMVFTPFRLTSGETVLVDRGFAPIEEAQAGAYAPAPSGEVAIVGRMRPPERRGPFTPSDEPARLRFFARDAGAIAAALGLAGVAPFTLDAETIAGAGAGWPRPLARIERAPNNHLSYALTWFGLAATLTVFFVVWARRR